MLKTVGQREGLAYSSVSGLFSRRSASYRGLVLAFRGVLGEVIGAIGLFVASAVLFIIRSRLPRAPITPVRAL